MDIHIRVLGLKQRLRSLKELCIKLNTEHLTKSDIKTLYFHLKRLLTTLHLLLFCEVLKIENNGRNKWYIKYMLFRLVKIIFKSEFVKNPKWELVQKHGLADDDTRFLIEKIAGIIKFSRIKK